MTDEVIEQFSQREFDELIKKFHRWGRWGIEDQRGALNLVTSEMISVAAQKVRFGKVVSLALPIGANTSPAWRHRFPPEYWMLRSGADVVSDLESGNKGMSVSDDALKFPLQSSTHWDALSHVFHDGFMYNGQRPEVLTQNGSIFSSIVSASSGMVGRGVLLDIAELRGTPHLQIGDTVEADDLERACEVFGVSVQQGDFVLVRTGRLGLAAASGNWGAEWSGGANAGLGFSTIEWLASRDVAAVACDNFSVEVIPAQTSHFGQRAPLHSILMQACGIYLGEMWLLEELHEVSRELKQYEFMLVAPPMLVSGAVGSPCNPQAIF
jgi:kynurenine formamidase